MAQLIGKDVTLGYEGNVVIEHLNFSVQAGDYLYIVGENGSGHGDIFKNTKGNYYYVYHVHNSDSCVSPRKARIVPLKMKKNSEGIYDISVSKNEVIKPYQY